MVKIYKLKRLGNHGYTIIIEVTYTYVAYIREYPPGKKKIPTRRLILELKYSLSQEVSKWKVLSEQFSLSSDVYEIENYNN